MVIGGWATRTVILHPLPTTHHCEQLHGLARGVAPEEPGRRYAGLKNQGATCHLNTVLQAKLLDQAQAEQQREESDVRRKLVGSGDRSEKIRTYNYPQGRVTDHRIKLTLYNLTEIMAGELDSVVQPLINEYQADLLASLAAED